MVPICRIALPPHSFEIIFYSTASLLVVIGLTWYFFR
jgi:hypothetical protein